MARAEKTPWDYSSILLTIEIRKGSINATWTAQAGDRLNLPSSHRLARRINRLMRDLYEEAAKPPPQFVARVARAKPAERKVSARRAKPEREVPWFREGDGLLLMRPKTNGRVTADGGGVFEGGAKLTANELVDQWTSKNLGWANGRGTHRLFRPESFVRSGKAAARKVAPSKRVARDSRDSTN